jgi:transglutaminase-like putative cysteine protease
MSLADFQFLIASGRFQFETKGQVSGKILTLRTSGAGEAERRIETTLKGKPYLTSGIISAIGAMQTAPGEAYAFEVFDPTTMGQQTVRVDVIGPEQITVSGDRREASKFSLSFKGATQYAWIDTEGELIKQSGLLGIRMEKTTREEALNLAAIQSSEDLTLRAAVPLTDPLPTPEQLQRLTLSVDGVPTEGLQLSGGRQHFAGGRLRIEKESLQGLPQQIAEAGLGRLEKVYLRPEPLIQADHPKIKQLVHTLLGEEQISPLEKIRRLADWVHRNLEKRPVAAVPDAVSTLENRMGDCNEHAMLLAAMARAAKIPARVEAGLVYLKGRFYYHAWNLVYLGRWVTVDALFGQLPADVTHVRLVTGSQQQQLDLIGLIGKIKIDVVDYD